VPLNRRYPLATLLGALRESPRITPRRPVFFEYTLIAGVNDSLDDARRLPELLRGIPGKVNLIPMNAHADSDHGPPSEEVADRFLRELARAGMTVTLRRSRGPDIDAACGQLALRSDPSIATPDAAPPPGSGTSPSQERAPVDRRGLRGTGIALRDR
jgi:23S rRNA (adenine2503-C2)-methyltransferase